MENCWILFQSRSNINSNGTRCYFEYIPEQRKNSVFQALNLKTQSLLDGTVEGNNALLSNASKNCSVSQRHTKTIFSTDASKEQNQYSTNRSPTKTNQTEIVHRSLTDFRPLSVKRDPHNETKGGRKLTRIC